MVFFNPPLLCYFPKRSFLFGLKQKFRMFKNLYFCRSRTRTPANSEDVAICNNSLLLKAVYESILTRSSILDVVRGSTLAFGNVRGPRPAFTMVFCKIIR